MSLTELAGVWGTGMEVLRNPHNFWVFWYGRTELTGIPGAGMKVFPNLQKSVHAYESLTELPERLKWHTVAQNLQKFRAGMIYFFPVPQVYYRK